MQSYRFPLPHDTDKTETDKLPYMPEVLAKLKQQKHTKEW